MTLEELAENHQTQDAVLRRLGVIGQAVKDLPSDLRERYPAVRWCPIAGMRDKLSHDYLGIDLEITWVAATEHLSSFAAQVQEILRDLG